MQRRTTSRCMPPASSNGGRSGARLCAGPACLALVAALACAIGVALAAPLGHPPTPAAAAPLFERLSTGTITLSPRAARRVTKLDWQAGPTTANTGETVNVEVSDAIPDPATVAQKWANFFAGLLHGSELQLLTVYVVPGTEVGSDCGGDPN